MQRVKTWLVVSSLIIGLAIAGTWLTRDDEPTPPTIDGGGRTTDTPRPPTPPKRKIVRTYAGSKSCASCHEQAYGAWRASHHALAEREIDHAQDRVAFVPPSSVRHGTLDSDFREVDKKFEVVTVGADGKRRPHVPQRVIGVAPLYQMVVPGERGRFQVTSLAYDPAKNQWFDVFGDEDRQPHEWGFWAQRGMTWNSMCAACHMTALDKGYDVESDSYSTTWKEMGVGCEACHGPYAEHVAWYQEHSEMQPWPDRPVRTPDTILDTCGSCHARRTELTPAYVPGEKFTDHYRPVMPDEPEIYYPDGQVKEEDYEYVSFVSSRMYTEGVRCIHCHEPHSGKLRLQGNALCLSCHKTKIDPVSHSHHDINGEGGQCMNCHMPLTTYMQRHPRRDHGFTIPDPLLTRESKIPNACNRCHTDKTVDWAIDAVEKWYGPRMERSTRARARKIAQAQEGKAESVEYLIRMVEHEKSPIWRGVAANLLGPWIFDEHVRASFLKWLSNPEPLVRAAAVRAFSFMPMGAKRVEHLLDDVSRLVRIEAAWANRSMLDVTSDTGKELLRHLDVIADQPPGMLQRGMFALERGDPGRARKWIERAIEWDPNSAPLYHALAIVYSKLALPHKAIEVLEKSEQIEPQNPELPYSKGLAHAETGDFDQAIEALERAVALEPRYARAWYNLGLARIEQDDVTNGLADLERAAQADPQNPEYPFAQAQVHMDRFEIGAARDAAKRALEVVPDFEPALRLLRSVQGYPGR